MSSLTPRRQRQGAQVGFQGTLLFCQGQQQQQGCVGSLGQTLPVADRHNDYAHEVEASLRRAGIRASTDTRSERVNAKIRDAQLRKVPYMLIVGDKEIESHSASVRLRSGENLGPIAVNDVVGRLVTESNERM